MTLIEQLATLLDCKPTKKAIIEKVKHLKKRSDLYGEIERVVRIIQNGR